MTSRPVRRAGGHVRRTRPIRRSSAGLSPVRAGAALAMLASAGAIYGLAATSAFSYARLDVRGTAAVDQATVRERLDLVEGQNLFQLATEPLAARLREIPAVADVEIRIGLPDTVAVVISERRPIAVWRVADRGFLVDESGVLFAEAGPTPSPEVAALPAITDARATSGALRITSILDPVDLDAAKRLASLEPAEVGSAATGLAVGVTDEHGFVLSSVPKSWVAVFGFYGRSQRTTELIPGQVQLLRSLLIGREPLIQTIILADDRDGTYIPKPTPKPSASPRP